MKKFEWKSVLALAGIYYESINKRQICIKINAGSCSE